jgi:mortality factor 4-like protein 1
MARTTTRGASRTKSAANPKVAAERVQKSSGVQKAATNKSAKQNALQEHIEPKANGMYSWDDWVPQDRLRKVTEDNLQLANNIRKEMSNMYNEARNKNPRKPTKARESVDVTSSPAPASRKRNRDQETQKEESYENNIVIDVNLPDLLHATLVDDWENVTKHLQLAKVPHDIPVNQVFDEWFAYEAKQRAPDTTSIDKLKEVIAGLKVYFKHTLGKLLLYRFERFQYVDIYYRTQDPTDELAGKNMGDIYGPEFLLRMLSQMPEFASHSGMSRQDLLLLKEELERLAIWIVRQPRFDRYFGEPYVSASKEYLDRLKWSNGGDLKSHDRA